MEDIDHCTSILSDMTSIRCTLGTPEIPKLASLYRPLIVRCARSIELLSHLKDAIDDVARQEVRQISRNDGDIASMECLLNHLEISNHPQKWQRLVDALEHNEYYYVAAALKGEEVPREVFVKYRKLLQENNLKFLGRFNPSDVVAELFRRKVINDMDKENIEAEQKIHGNICATHVLLDRVWRHKQNWYEEFMDVLCENYAGIVKGMDEHHVKWNLDEKTAEVPVGRSAYFSENKANHNHGTNEYSSTSPSFFLSEDTESLFSVRENISSDTAVSACLPSTSTSVTEKDADKKDICTSLMAENCQGKRCDKHHTRLPYLWQVRIFGSWVSFNDLENQNVEKSYCSLSEIQDAEVDHEQKKYKIHLRFNENLGVVYEIWHGNESLNTNDVLSIRRLSTASSAKEKKPLTTGSFHTQWRWYFQDDVEQWILFDKEFFQYTLEKIYTLGQRRVDSVTRENLRVEFADLTQIDIVSGKERKVLRRPLLNSICPQILDLPTPNLQSLGPTTLGGAPGDLDYDFELVDLEESSKEYQDVKFSIFEKLKEECLRVCKICRVRVSGNTKINTEKEDGKGIEQHSPPDTYSLYTNTSIVWEENFIAYSKGPCFTTTAKTIGIKRDSLGLIFRSRVLISQYSTQENIPMTWAGHKRYDCSVENVDNLSVFALFYKTSSLPHHGVADEETEILRPTTMSAYLVSAHSEQTSEYNTNQASYISSQNIFPPSTQDTPMQPSYRANCNCGATQPIPKPGLSLMFDNPYAPSLSTSSTSSSQSESSFYLPPEYKAGESHTKAEMPDICCVQ